MVSRLEGRNRQNAFSVVIVTAADVDGFPPFDPVTVEDDDPTSPTYVSGNFRARPLLLRPEIADEDQPASQAKACSTSNVGRGAQLSLGRSSTLPSKAATSSRPSSTTERPSCTSSTASPSLHHRRHPEHHHPQRRPDRLGAGSGSDHRARRPDQRRLRAHHRARPLPTRRGRSIEEIAADGEPKSSSSGGADIRAPYLDSYAPFVGDVVVLFIQGRSRFILGRLIGVSTPPARHQSTGSTNGAGARRKRITY